MGRLTITLPRLGETMEEAKVVEWLVSPGAAFKRGAVLLEVETDKTVVEVPALTDGVLQAQLVAVGETVALGQPIADIEADVIAAPEPTPTAPPPPLDVKPEAARAHPAAPAAVAPPPGQRPAASPAARAAARGAGVDLALIAGSGRRGRVTAADVAEAASPSEIAVHRVHGGRGMPVVLLHGLFDDHRGWRDVPRRLAAAGHEVMVVDLPGHGASTMQAQTLEAAVDQIAAILPEGRLYLIGHSLGAAIATRLALRLGDRVEHLVLSAPAGLGPRINSDFIDGVLAAETPAALARALALLDAGPISAMALTQELDRLRKLRSGYAALAAAAARGGFQQIDITADLARLACTVSVIFGTADRILDWQEVVNLPAAAAIHLIRGAGHLPHVTAPESILRLIPDAATPFRRSDQV